MSDDVVIKAENLGKCYRINHEGPERYVALRDVAAHAVAATFRRFRVCAGRKEGAENASKEDFWALRDVSFEVRRGEVLGIIGRNGAGKSTLLKVLSRITEPTKGRVRVRGRVASLLEVGTGFHPELTGRENIFLNGAILGMSRAEIRRKFDEIVAFAEVEKFLDTPVKRYSSGMYVRLAFAVAAHLEPEILVVDEVLAVGDAEFQKKCLGKMRDVAGHGRTVLFVSHNMVAVRRLCSRGILLRKGCLAHIGEINAVIDSYLNGAKFREGARYHFPPQPGRPAPCFASVEIRNTAGEPRNTIPVGEPFEVVLTLNNPLGTAFASIIGVEVLDTDGVSLFTSHSDDITREMTQLPPGVSTVACLFKMNPLMPGTYHLQLGMVDRNWSLVDFACPELSLRVDEASRAGYHLHLTRPGRLIFEFPWKFGAHDKATRFHRPTSPLRAHS